MRRRLVSLSVATLLCACAWSIVAGKSRSGARIAAPPSRVHQTVLHNAVFYASAAVPRRAAVPAPVDKDETKITALIATLRPKKGPEFARAVASHIVHSARENGLSPYVVSATAVVESEFDMTAGPCIGVMQLHPATVSEVYGRSGRDVHSLRDNIWMGANYLARNYRATLPSRGGEEDRMRIMWGRYNGAGPRSVYVSRALRVLRRIKTGTPSTWKQKIRKTGSLWGVRANHR